MLLPVQVKLATTINLTDVPGINIINNGQDIFFLVYVKGMELKGFQICAGVLLAVLNGTLVDRHKGARDESQLIVELKRWCCFQRWLSSISQWILVLSILSAFMQES